MRLFVELHKFANSALFTGGLIVMLILLGSASSGMCNTVDGLNNQPDKTPKVGDPVSAATGEELMTLPLFHLPGPMPIDLTLYYMSQSSSPSEFGNQFFLNVPYMWRIGDDISVTFVNGMDEVEFHKNAENDWEMIGHSSWPYELKAAGDHFFLKNSADNTVFYFEKFNDFLWLCRKKMDRAGNSLTYTYSAFAGKSFPGLVSIESSAGRKIDFTIQEVNGKWVVTAIETDTTPAQSRTFSYTGGYLTSMVNPDGKAATFAYDGDNRLTAMTTPRGTVPYTSEYDSVEVHGTDSSMFIPVVVKQTDAMGNITQLAYDFPDNKVIETRPDGRQNTFITAGYQGEYGRTGGAALQVSPSGLGTLNFQQNGEGNITQAQTQGGATLSFDYDATSGRLSSYAVGNDRISMDHTPVAQTFYGLNSDTAAFIFADETSRLYFPSNGTETLTYDDKGNLLTFQDMGGNIWSYTRNSRGQATQIENPLGAVETFSYNTDQLLATHSSSVSGTTTMVYDAYGRLTTTTDGMGNTRTLTYDDMGRLTQEVNELGQVTGMAYDPNGNLDSTTDPQGNVTEFTYDPMDRLVRTQAANGETASITYDSMGQVASTTGPSGISTQYQYTAGGLVSRMIKGNYIWEGAYDTDGLLATDQETGGVAYTYAHDAAGRVTRIQDVEGRVWQYTYDAFGKLLTSINPAGQTIQYAYDGMGRLMEATLPGNRKGTYEYNGIGNLTQITGPQGGKWQFQYTTAGQLTQQTDPLGGTISYTYDTLGRMATRTDAMGTMQTFEHDALDRVTRINSGSDILTYAFDPNGRMTQTRGLSLTYDALSRVTRCMSGNTTYDLTWNTKGQLVTLTQTPGNLTIAYTYDAITGDIVSVSDSKGLGSASFSYDDAGRVTGITRKNGVSTTFTVDAATSRITHVTDGDFTDVTYTLDTLGRITALDGALPLEPGAYLSARDETHTFNAMNQVTDAGYTYDAAGRLLATPDMTLSWNGFSQLTAINDAVYTYDGLNRILTAALNGTTTGYSYCGTVDSQTPLRIHNDAIEWTQVVAPGWGLVYSIRTTPDGEAVVYYHTDCRGSVIAVTDAAGAVIHRFGYTPYGRLLADEGVAQRADAGSPRPPFLYLGHYGCHTLPGTEALYRHGARAYFAAVGQFVSPETEWPDLGNPARLNVYHYATSDPINYVDFNGFAMDINKLREAYASLEKQFKLTHKQNYKEPETDPNFKSFPDYRRIPVRQSSELNAALEENKGEIWVDFYLAYNSPFRDVLKGLGKINRQGRARIIPEENFGKALEIAEKLIIYMGYDTRYANGNFLKLGQDIVEWIWWERERLKKVRRKIALTRGLLFGEGELSPGAGMVEEAIQALGLKFIEPNRKKEIMFCPPYPALDKAISLSIAK